MVIAFGFLLFVDVEAKVIHVQKRQFVFLFAFVSFKGILIKAFPFSFASPLEIKLSVEN